MTTNTATVPVVTEAVAIARTSCAACGASITVFDMPSGRTVGMATPKIDLRTRLGRDWASLPTEALVFWQCQCCDRWQ